jgi:hypothetical protein
VSVSNCSLFNRGHAQPTRRRPHPSLGRLTGLRDGAAGRPRTRCFHKSRHRSPMHRRRSSPGPVDQHSDNEKGKAPFATTSSINDVHCCEKSNPATAKFKSSHKGLNPASTRQPIRTEANPERLMNAAPLSPNSGGKAGHRRTSHSGQLRTHGTATRSIFIRSPRRFGPAMSARSSGRALSVTVDRSEKDHCTGFAISRVIFIRILCELSHTHHAIRLPTS